MKTHTYREKYRHIKLKIYWEILKFFAPIKEQVKEKERERERELFK